MPKYIIIFISCSSALFSQSFWGEQDKKAYTEMFALRFDNADSYLSKSLSQNPHKPSSLYLKDYLSSIKLFLNDDIEGFKTQQTESEKLIQILGSISENSPYKKFLIAETKLHQSLLKMRFGEEFSAALDLRTAYKLLESNKKEHPDFVPHLKSLGMLHVLIGSIPPSYKWVINIVGMKGSVAEGIKELETCVNSKNEFSLESELYLHLVNAFLLKKTKETLESLEKSYQIHPDNLAICLILAQTLITNQYSEKALLVLQQKPNSREYYEVPMIQKMLADCFFYASDHEKSKKHYDAFKALYKGQNYLKDVSYKFFLMEWFTKGTQNLKYLKAIKEEGSSNLEIDKHALKFANDIDNQNLTLTKIRVLYDGGYFANALEMINRCKISEFKQKNHLQEFYYRKARVLSSLQSINEAIECYKKAIALHDEKYNTYMAANSCLQLGFIYLDRYDKLNAKIYFEKSIDSYSGHEYESSIENKAKAALSSLK